jgi:hypothetical protein
MYFLTKLDAKAESDCLYSYHLFQHIHSFSSLPVNWQLDPEVKLELCWKNFWQEFFKVDIVATVYIVNFNAYSS